MERNGEIFEFLEAVDNIANYDIEEDLLAGLAPRRRGNIYLRNLQDPYNFFSEQEFVERYRFQKDTVRNIIVPLLSDEHHFNMRGLPIPVELQAVIALRFYATGSIQEVCGDLHFVSQPTVSRIVRCVSAQLAECVSNHIKFPNDLQAVSHAFEFNQSRYPGLKHIIGAIDCTHIKIRRPRCLQNSEVYRNRKGFFSINTQAIVGPTMKIYDIVARWPGSSHDSRIFRSSRVHADLESGLLPGILVGDSGYRATTYMLTPINNPTTQAQTRFNYVQVRTRNVIERFFGVWKQRFGCLRVGLATKLSTSVNTIIACAVLHNIAVDANEELILNENFYEEDMALPAARHNRSGLAFRNQIINQYYDY